MALFENFPYTDMHNLNLDWIIKIAKDFLDQYTHIQQLISDGEQSLTDLTESGVSQLQETAENGLSQLQEKADNLETLLQEWYNTHSDDIAGQLADALDDLNSWYTTHQNYLDATLAANISAFNSAADQKAAQTIATIPDDYTTLSNKVNLIDKMVGGKVIDGQLFTPFLSFFEYDKTTITPTYTSGSICLATGLIGSFANSRITNKITLDDGALYHISALVFPTEGSYFIFYDVDDNVSATLPTPGLDMNRKDFYVIGSKYYKSVIVNTGLSSDAVIEKIVITKSYLENTINDILDNLPDKKLPLVMNNSMLINDHGEAISYPAGGDTWRVSDEIDVTLYDKLKIYTRMGYDNCYFAFYDASHNPVSYVNSPHSDIATFDDYVIVPDTAKYIRIAVFGSTFPCYIAVLSNNSWKGKKWVCIGDSITENNIAASKHYFDYIADATGIEPVNYGVGGTGYANPGNNSEGNFVTRMASVPTDADVYTIFGSFNDYNYNSLPIGNPSDSGTTSLCGYFNAALDALFARVPLANVGIIAPTPWSTINQVTSWGTFGKDYSDALKAVCERRCVPFLNMYTDSGLRPWDSSFANLAYYDTIDPVHPNATGHKIMAPKIQAFLDRLLIH